MKPIEEVVKIIAESYKEEMEEHECESLREYFKIMWYTKEDYIGDFIDRLNEAHADDKFNYTDDMELITDEKVYTCGEIIRKVKAYKF